MVNIENTGRKNMVSGGSGSVEPGSVRKPEQETAAGKNGREEAAFIPRKDSVELSPGWEERAGLKKSVKELLLDLQKEYSGISIGVCQPDGSGLREMAVHLGKGTHLVITRDFLEKMWSSEEEFAVCRDALTEILDQLSAGKDYYAASGAYLEKDQVSFWSVPKKEDDMHSAFEQMQNMLENFKEQNSTAGASKKKDYRYRASVSDYDAAGKYAKLAGAGSRSAVQTVMGEAQRSIGSLRMVSCFGEEKERMAARATIRSLQKLLLRGRRKISRLREEELLEIRKKRAREQDQEEKARKIRAEIKKMKQSRSTADGAIRMEGKLDAYWIDWRRKCLRADEEEQREYEIMVSDGMAGAEGAAGPASAGIGGGESFAAQDVTVSAPISF